MPTVTQVGNTSNSYTSPPIELDEFLPVVRFTKPENYVVEGEELIQSKEDVKLSKHLDKDKTKFKILQLTTQKNKLKLPFTIKQGKGKKGSWFQDDDGFIEPKISIQDDTIKITSATKLFKKYDSEIEVEIEITSKESKTFYLDFYANDDENDYNKGDYENVHCGKIKIIYKIPNEWEFSKDKIDKIKVYAIDNNKNYPGSTYSDYHHCTDTHKHIVYKLLDNPNGLDLGKDQLTPRDTPKDYEKAGESTTAGVRNTLIVSTYAEPSKTFTVIDINNKEVVNSNGTAGNTDNALKGFKESPIEYMKSKCPDNGYYVFIGAYNDDYHSFTVIVKKEDDNFSFEFVDQLVGINNHDEIGLEKSKMLGDIWFYRENFPMKLELYQLRNKKK